MKCLQCNVLKKKETMCLKREQIIKNKFKTASKNPLEDS